MELGLTLRIWVAVCVTSLAAFCQFAWESWGALSTPKWLVLGVVFLSTLALYNLDDTLEALKTGSNSKSSRSGHLTLTLLSGLGLLFCLPALPTPTCLLCLGGLGLAALYAVPSRKPATGLVKTLPGLKAPFVGVAVAVASVWVPGLTHSENHRNLFTFVRREALSAGLLTLVLALLCTTNAILFDIPDREADSALGISTLPVEIGVRKSARRCLLLLACASVLWLSAATTGILAPTPLTVHAGLAALTIALSLFCFLTNEHTSKTFVAFWVDGALVLPLFVVVLFG